jgi:hypothetical protein
VTSDEEETRQKAKGERQKQRKREVDSRIINTQTVPIADQ